MIWIICVFTLFLTGCEQKPQESHYKEVIIQAGQVSAPSVLAAPTIPAEGTMPPDKAMPADPHAGLDMSAMAGLPDMPATQNFLTWTLPEGWKEEPGKHMRMASFYSMAYPKAIDCYIIALAGPAGGLDANLERWLGQIGLKVSDDNLRKLSSSAQALKTKDGLDVKVFDFTLLQSHGNLSDNSMVVAMIPLEQTTVFVKMTGTVRSVKQNKENFLKLLGSISRK